MALAVNLRFDFVDDKNGKSHTNVKVPTGFTIANYLEFGQGMAQLLSNLSAAQITRASVTFAIDLSTAVIKAVASGLSDVAQKAFFMFRSAVAGFYNRLKLPAFSESKIISGSDSVDTSDPDVSAFIAAMENGLSVTGGTIAPSDDRENDLAALHIAKEQFRRTL